LKIKLFTQIPQFQNGEEGEIKLVILNDTIAIFNANLYHKDFIEQNPEFKFAKGACLKIIRINDKYFLNMYASSSIPPIPKNDYEKIKKLLINEVFKNYSYKSKISEIATKTIKIAKRICKKNFEIT